MHLTPQVGDGRFVKQLQDTGSIVQEHRFMLASTSGVRIGSILGFAFGLAAAGGIACASLDDAPVPQPTTTPTEAPKPSEIQPAKPADVKVPVTKIDEKKTEKPVATPVSPYVLDTKVNDIDGAEQDLSQYKGKVLLIVNVASKCGFTPQYGGLEKLYKDKKDKGLVVLGFPSNDFGRQEPGSESEIREFCSSKYSVTFPMFSKVGTTGENAHPLYQKLASQAKPIGGEPGWNFTKFLVNREGNVVARFDSRVKPDDAEMNRVIDELIAGKVPVLDTTPSLVSKPTEATVPAPEKK